MRELARRPIPRFHLGSDRLEQAGRTARLQPSTARSSHRSGRCRASRGFSWKREGGRRLSAKARTRAPLRPSGA